ncbi:MAG: hypothetical protein RLY78_2064 [Pseudomonadota bacterium]
MWTDPEIESLGGVIAAIGRPDFAARALAALQPAVQAASWSVYALRRGGPPQLHLSATGQGPDLTRACFDAYARGLYLRDSSFDPVRAAAADGPRVMAMHADAAPNRDHREAIYRAHQVLERMSVAALDARGTLLAVNVYHHEDQGPFSEAERQRFQALAPLLYHAVRRQVDWQRETPAASAQARRQALQAAAPGLTVRELDVCERLLRGWSHDGVAADLGLSLATVKTYRARAFARLGLHFRSELFARFGHARSDGADGPADMPADMPTAVAPRVDRAAH